ncbi:MAG: sel1 repeat family protein [Alphaproteobacteria bacterium]|nr:sel1 repeat family protein [Alphaproteobacteria bacterium]
MSIKDDQTTRIVAQATEVNAAEATVMADDMRTILKLIATQLEDSDRRQSEVLGDMHRRLAEMGNDARRTRAQVPETFAPAFERIEEGIGQLARLVAAAELHQPGSSIFGSASAGEVDAGQFMTGRDFETDEDADWRATIERAGAVDQRRRAESGVEDLPDHSEERSKQGVATFAPVSSLFRSAGEAFDSEFLPEREAGAEDMMITDNAADRFDFYADADADECHESFDASGTGQADQSGSETRAEPPVFANAAFEYDSAPPHHEASEEPHAHWDRDQAEALTRIYEAHLAGDDVEPAPFAPRQVSGVAALAAARTLDGMNDELPEAARPTGKEDMRVPMPESRLQNGSQPCVPTAAPIIEQAWLEARFAEIAAKIEESIFELRDDQALLTLSDRFGEFEERVGLALEDVATRHDVDALRSAEAQIDSMVGYFERVEAQLGRIDSLEGHMETLLDRLSDDNIMQFVSGQGGSAEFDYTAIAEAAAESVAQRFLAEFANGAIGGHGDSEAVGDMREALDAFITERRERDEEAAGMLDTIQQALIRVLDRVEVLEAGYENPPMTSPLDDDFAEVEVDAADKGSEPAAALPDRRTERPRPQSDYSQTRLEYPAAVMGIRPAEAKFGVEPQVQDEPEVSGYEQAEEVFGDNYEAARDAHAFGEAQAGAEHDAARYNDQQITADGPQVQADLRPDWQPDERSESALSPIDRLRQEFIADARRARERAAEQALLSEAGVESESAPAKSRLSLPGLSSLGAKVRGTASASKAQIPAPAPGKSPAEASPKAPAAAKPAGRPKALPGDAAAAAAGSRFALPRSKLLVGAVIVLFATAGALLMMRSPSQPISDVAPPVIEQTFDKETPGPQLSGPEETVPALKGEEAPDRRGSLDGGRIYDGEFNYDVPSSDELRPLASGLAGVAVADLDTQPNPAAVARAQRQQRLARMSSDLGAAAAYATPANLITEQPTVEQSEAAQGPLARAGDGNHLDLPPATVGPLSLRLAAAKGDPSAQFEVAARLAGGTGTQQDLKGSVHWYQLAAAQGFAQAQYRLGTLYERGLGVDKDLARAGVWYERAAAKGNVKAMHNLAVVSAGRDAGGPDYTSAAKWFDAAAQYGLSDSQFNLAVLCENGLGVEKDLKRAYVYYALASTKGDEQAKTRREAVRAMLSNDDLEAAERQVQAFRPKTADRIVNDARVAGEDWKKRADGGY